MAISASDGSDQKDLDQLETEFLELLNTASNPTDPNSVSSDRLAKKLGLDGLPDREEAFKLLEQEILAPVRDLSGPGLSQWQTSVLSLKTSYHQLMIRQSPITLPLPPQRLTPLPATHTVLPLSRGIEGTFSRWREAIAPKPPAHPALSSSTTRAPGSTKNFVRGKGSYAPFLPGGLDEKEDLAPEEGEEEVEEEDGWKTRAPGLKRGVQLSGGKLETLEISAKLTKQRMNS